MKKQIIALSIISLVGITHQSLAMNEGDLESMDKQQKQLIVPSTQAQFELDVQRSILFTNYLHDCYKKLGREREYLTRVAESELHSRHFSGNGVKNHAQTLYLRELSDDPDNN